MPRVIPRRPHDHHHPPTQVSRRDEAGLAVVAPVVRGNRMEAGKDLDGIGKVEPRCSSVASRFAGSKVILTTF